MKAKARREYPTHWSQIAYEVKAANDWRCQACGRLCRRPGELYLGWEWELTCAHLSQDYDAEAVTVAALCVRCHLAYDAAHSWVARCRAVRRRQQAAGQLAILNFR